MKCIIIDNENGGKFHTIWYKHTINIILFLLKLISFWANQSAALAVCIAAVKKKTPQGIEDFEYEIRNTRTCCMLGI